ncbi:MAG TPA: sce7726 family protein [Candidatus Acidoferrales bacterium]|nr:sce7726 family protein [Candidatus Acidoferrales bacterium]
MSTNDKIIRIALKKYLEELHARDSKLRIVEEFGVEHGAARVDVAVVNGALHGYEIKSDKDTLSRLPGQMDAYNAVFDQVTLIVGKQHVYEAINLVPDWWGISVAKIGTHSSIIFTRLREAKENLGQRNLSIARLLWRGEALQILEEVGEANGLRSKPRERIYEKLSAVFDQVTLEEKVRSVLFVREDWRSDAPLVLNGG